MGDIAKATSLKGGARYHEPRRCRPPKYRRRHAVRLFNDRGACLSVVKLTDGVMPGVIHLTGRGLTL